MVNLLFNFQIVYIVIKDEFVTNENGIECILETMKNFPYQESLQTTALFALGSIVVKSGIMYLHFPIMFIRYPSEASIEA